MKAAIYRQYGPPEVVRIEEVPRPDPKENEVLIRIRASTVNSGDARIRGLNMPRGFGLMARPAFGMFGPRKKVLGTELAGEIASIGKSVSRFKVGDRVFAFPGIGLGCHAEYRTMAELGPILPMPGNMNFEHAAAISFGGTTALYFLRNLGKIQSGEKVLIIGGSGTVGSAAVQLAKHFGAEVSAVASTSNLTTVQSLGADHVIDYTKGNYLKSDRTWDLIFDTVGVGGYPDYRAALAPNGRLLLAAADLPQMLGAAISPIISKHKVLVGGAPERLEDLRLLRDLAEAGTFKPLIDHSFPLEQIAAAHARVDSGRKRGSVVIAMYQKTECNEI